MTKSSCFAIYIEPLSPVILGRRLNLDALLAYLLLQKLTAAGVEEPEALIRAHAEIPLEQIGGVYAGSSALVPRTRVSTRTIYGSFQRFVTAMPNFDMFERNAPTRVGGREWEKIEKTYQTFVSTHDEYHLHRPQTNVEADREWGLWFVGYGDRAACEDLIIPGLRYIGAKRTPIRQPVFHEATPSKMPGLIGHDDTVLRPVPVDAIAPMTGKYSRSYERVRPPYWQQSSLATEPVLCYVPPAIMRHNINEIKTAIGVA